MGQYYHPCIVGEDERGFAVVLAWLLAYNYGAGIKQMEHSYLGNDFVASFEWLISPEGPHHKAKVAWAGDYGGVEEGYDCNLYRLCGEENHASPKGTGFKYPFIVNHTQRCYINKNEVNGEIHPLPLLTMETEGGGGGDYRGINEHLLGSWARNVISVEEIVPEGYEKVSYEFREGR